MKKSYENHFLISNPSILLKKDNNSLFIFEISYSSNIFYVSKVFFIFFIPIFPILFIFSRNFLSFFLFESFPFGLT